MRNSGWISVKKIRIISHALFLIREENTEKKKLICVVRSICMYIFNKKINIKKNTKKAKWFYFYIYFLTYSLVINNHLWSQANQDVRKGHIYIQGVRKILPKTYISRSFLCMFQYYRGKHTNVRVYTLMFLSSENVLKFCSRQYFSNTL